jgi:hypothetical protein
VVTVDQPSEQCRLALRFRLAAAFDDAACGAVLAHLLDGPDGLLYLRLRIEAGLAYGTVAVANEDGRPNTLVVGLSLLGERLPAAIDAVRRCVEEIDCGTLAADELAVAAAGVADRVLAKLDEPFGALEDHRRQLDGHGSLGAVADRAHAAAERLARPGRLSTAHRPAVAYVGAVDNAVPDLLRSLW